MEKTYETTVSDFLTPNALSEVLNFLKWENITYKVYGGFLESERNKIVFSKYEISEKDFDITLLEINYNSKYSKILKHGDFLGSLIGLGLERKLIGDIIVNEKAVVAVSTHISDYIKTNLEKVGKTKVTVKVCEKLNLNIKEKEEKKMTVASLRVDVVLCAVHNLSRNKIKELIQSNKLYINFELVKDSSKKICENDIITLRSYGKFKYTKSVGISKKNKIIIKVIKY